MFTEPEMIRGEVSTALTDRRVWIWQGIAAALLVIWLLTLTLAHFKDQIVEGQYLAVIRQDLVGAVQQLAQQQQTLSQRLQALEAMKGKE
jgi:hypothetical protein